MNQTTAGGRDQSRRRMSEPYRPAPRREAKVGPMGLRRFLHWWRSLGMRTRIAHHVDIQNQEVICGWAVHERGTRAVRVFRDEVAIGDARLGLERPDVHAAFPRVAGSDRAGFCFPIASHLKEGANEITLEIEAGDGTRTRTSREIVGYWRGGRHSPQRFRPGVDKPLRTGLPFEVTGVLRAFRSGTYEQESNWSDELMARATSDLEALWHSGARAPALNRYILYLKTMYDRFCRVSVRFPRINDRAAIDAKDSGGMATTPAEMLAIANQLYVLKSHGLEGDFLEFGCFKGFSSCCLSFCCRHLDLRMEIFDSFAGLPPSDSQRYSAGEYCGTFEEVYANIDEFGDPGVIEFHKGFFADTVPHFSQKPIISIWMDVDLFSSARDVARIFDWLPVSSVLFTHEFPADGAEGGRVIRETSEVFPPILDRFASLGRTPVGRHLDGHLGAIWDAAEGIPVLPQHLLMDLVHLGD